jgi:hypothetical protein
MAIGQRTYNMLAGALQQRLATGRSQTEGSRPTRMDFSGVANASTGYPTLQLNQQGYSEAMFGWLQNQDDYAGWNESDLRQFTEDISRMTPEQAAAHEMATQNRRAWDENVAAAEADRAHMLSELAAFKQGYGQEWISGQLSRERALGEAQIRQTVAGAHAQYAQMGRVASPYVMARLQMQLESQLADRLQARRFELERVRMDALDRYNTMLNDVYKSTERPGMDPMAAAELVQQLGKGASSVAAA